MPADVFSYLRKTRKPSPVSDVDILWITAGLGCDGDSVSVMAGIIVAGKLATNDLVDINLNTDQARKR